MPQPCKLSHNTKPIILLCKKLIKTTVTGPIYFSFHLVSLPFDHTYVPTNKTVPRTKTSQAERIFSQVVCINCAIKIKLVVKMHIMVGGFQ